MKNTHILLVLILLLSGCNRQPSVVLALKVESTNPQTVAACRNILEKRFKEILPTLFSSVNSTIKGSTISFQFRNGAPGPADLDYLISTPGRLVASLHNPTGHGNTWFTDEDIEFASTSKSNGEMFITLKLTEKAGKYLKRVTSQHIGDRIDVTLDGKNILRAVIQDSMGRYSQFTAPDPDKAVDLATILLHGHLPAKIVKVR